ncbi:hypothetical protein [Micromonospora okii]|uniref:hypothetical protein n=1 Tax=Micromonospora okii TaxID=1182970 RepID=UPI00272EBFCA|nr:hypothetical protein [Micromonospora okii]
MPAPPFPPPPLTSTTAPAGSPVVVPAPALPSWPPPTDPMGWGGAAPVSGAPASGAPAADRPAPGLYGTAPTTAWQVTPTSGAPTDRATGGRATAGPPGRPTTRATAARRDPGTADLASIAYGTEGPGFATVALPAGNPLDNSGSLTGHILAQGWADSPTHRSSTTKVVIVLAASLGLLVAISVLVVLLAGDTVDGLVGGLIDI